MLVMFLRKLQRNNAAGLAITGGIIALITITLSLLAAHKTIAPAPLPDEMAQTGQSVIKLADATALLALLPPAYNGAMRTDDNTSSGGAGGIAVSTAEGSYHIGDGTVNVKVTDMGTVAGIGAMAAAMNLNSSSSSATGYEKVTTENGRMVTEKWDNAAKHGEYAIVSDGRFSVEAEGDNVDMATLKSVVSGIDLGRARALIQ